LLVLGRKKDETIIIKVPVGTDYEIIKLTVVETQKGKCRIGLEADDKISIMRGELLHVDR
jgi:carbon storage regulator CsrA